MADCCSNQKELIIVKNGECPSCKTKANNVKLITLKAMLKPSILETLNIKTNYYFCSNNKCDVVYFDTDNNCYIKSDVKVPVYQKEKSTNVPICYCFNWTKEKIKEHIENNKELNPVENIKQNIKEGRCGCEINNPQGSCCLGNVTSYIKDIY